MDSAEFEKTVLGLFPGLTDRQTGQFRSLQELYGLWNSRINVISRKDMDGLYLHHVLHSLAIAGYIRDALPGEWERWTACPSQVKVLDLGTGGGFPGIPLAVMFPQVSFTLCDSIGKKVTVASEVAAALGLDNVRTVVARAETLEGGFDYVVSRAVTSLDRFMPWVKGKYSRGVLYLKGGDVTEEIATAMGRFGMKKGSVRIWKVRDWYDDPYFDGKLVIDIDRI